MRTCTISCRPPRRNVVNAIAIALVAAGALCVGGVVGWELPKPKAPSYKLTCQTTPQRFVSNTPGVIVEPVLLCWKAIP